MMGRLFKLIVHVPVTHSDVVRQAVGDAGGGRIGHYSHCSFTSRGVGRFRPLDGAQPYVGEVGGMEAVEEDKIEIGWIEEALLAEVVAAARRVHPYEEPAIEVMELVRV